MLFADFNPFKAPSFDAVMILLILIAFAMQGAVKVFKTTDKEGEIREAVRQKAKGTILGWIFGRKK